MLIRTERNVSLFWIVAPYTSSHSGTEVTSLCLVNVSDSIRKCPSTALLS